MIKWSTTLFEPSSQGGRCALVAPAAPVSPERNVKHQAIGCLKCGHGCGAG